MNLSLVFYSGLPEYGIISDAEKDALLELWTDIWDLDPQIGLWGDISRVYVTEAIDFLRDMTDYEFSCDELMREMSSHGWTYMEDWDAYYFMHGDTEYRLVSCFDVAMLDGGQTEIYYTDEADLPAMLTIETIGGRVVFLSNRYL